ncbi:secretion-regulating guanine nucleotide exchange factor isoform X2 [Acipenser ruthenus]|uniref:secretion-regulating guanine nucleotide exchange factor isoform X2 n=1 Tax=Acipenser ruthenus TaxID=7906 RepID=UPI0027410C0F|nr:secretion-regulating guanine nucleotide exchange factor isoform X2 [Acipenser ruthenus]
MRKCGWVRATCVLFTSMADRSPCSELFCLFTWGANSYGQLGLGHKEDVLQPEGARLGQCLEGGVRTLAGGGGHSAVVTGAGEVLLCGQNNKGQLGLGHTVDALLFTPCAALRGHNVVQVAGGWDFTLILTGDGRVLACGSNAFGQLGVPHHPAGSSVPLPIKSLTEKVVEVAAGLRHALAVTEAGRVYQWGTGMAAQAKRTLQPRPVPAFLVAKQPCQVPVMENVKVRKVAAGACHSVCLTEEGAVFMWGSNKHGQLTSSEPFLCQALRIHPRLFKGAAVSAVWSGWTHVVCRTERGDIFTWGRADYGQLGRKAAANGSGRTEARDLTDGSSTQSATCIPLTVLDLAGASQVSCGSEHNLAVVEPGLPLKAMARLSHSGITTEGLHVTAVPAPVFEEGKRAAVIQYGALNSWPERFWSFPRIPEGLNENEGIVQRGTLCTVSMDCKSYFYMLYKHSRRN